MNYTYHSLDFPFLWTNFCSLTFPNVFSSIFKYCLFLSAHNSLPNLSLTSIYVLTFTISSSYSEIFSIVVQKLPQVKQWFICCLQSVLEGLNHTPKGTLTASKFFLIYSYLITFSPSSETKSIFSTSLVLVSTSLANGPKETPSILTTSTEYLSNGFLSYKVHFIN